MSPNGNVVEQILDRIEEIAARLSRLECVFEEEDDGVPSRDVELAVIPGGGTGALRSERATHLASVPGHGVEMAGRVTT